MAVLFELTGTNDVTIGSEWVDGPLPPQSVTIKAPSTYNLSITGFRLSLWTGSIDDTEATLYIKAYATGDGYNPTGDVLATASIARTTLTPDSYNYYTINLDTPISINAGEYKTFKPAVFSGTRGTSISL